MRCRRGRHRRDERGLALVLSVIVLAVLLGVTALVIDLGYGRGQKRILQNAADAASLAAAQCLPYVSVAAPSDSPCAGTTADARAKGEVARILPSAAIDWANCRDPVPLPNRASSPCITYDSSYTRARVYIPKQTYGTLFAGIIGSSTMQVSAKATAQLSRAGLGTLLPFSMFATFNAPEACLKTGTNGQAQFPCNGSTTGNFGFLDVRQYGNAALGTPSRCGNGAQTTRLTNNVALGIDHGFTVWTGPPERIDECAPAPIPGPNTLEVRTGNVASAFDDGLVHGTGLDDGGPARLARGGYAKTSAFGVPLDNLPLWQFIPAVPISGVPASCQRSTFTALLTVTPTAQQPDVLHGALAQCIADYAASGSTVPVFTADTDPFGREAPYDLYDIQLSPRFSYVPQMAESNPPSGSSGLVHLARYRAVFLQSVYARCTGQACGLRFDPGPWNAAPTGATNDTADAVTAWVIPATMLPGNLGANPYQLGAATFTNLID